MQETEQSEKDMIGSLLDGIYNCYFIEDESECSEFRSSITKS
jgi:pumilio RNA-binding family